jgi:hypothetical protein
MAREIKIFDHREYDRVIGVLFEDNKVKNITFMQGPFDKDTIGMLTNSLLEEVSVMIKIFYNLLGLNNENYEIDSQETLFKKTCELYFRAFIYPEIEL